MKNNNLSVFNNEVKTMSSLEIAELTGKQHKHVIRDIKAMLLELFDGPKLDHDFEVKDARGYTSAFNLPKRETLILVSGYNIQMRAKIIDRWQELENEATPSYMIDDEEERALAWIKERRELKAIQQQALALEQKVKEDEHKVNLYECFTGSEQSEMTMAEVAKAFSAKILKTSGGKPIGRNRFMEILRLNKIIDSNNIAYQRYVGAGYFKIKNSPRNGMNFFSTQWTPKGLDWLNRNADKLNSNQDIELD